MNRLLDQLFRDYYKDVYRYLFCLSRDADLSEELAAEVFLSVVLSFGKFRGESDVRTWLFSIARNKYFSYLRKQKLCKDFDSVSRFIEDCSFCSPEEDTDIRELYSKITVLLNSEDERTQGIVLMRSEGYSFYEIALKYGIAENSARVIFHRTKEKIKEKLKKEGFF